MPKLVWIYGDWLPDETSGNSCFKKQAKTNTAVVVLPNFDMAPLVLQVTKLFDFKILSVNYFGFLQAEHHNVTGNGKILEDTSKKCQLLVVDMGAR